MVCERGQATIEWTGLALLVAIVLGALATLAPRVDGRGLGATVAHAITCAARGGCAAELVPGNAGAGLRSGRPEEAAAEARSTAAEPGKAAADPRTAADPRNAAAQPGNAAADPRNAAAQPGNAAADPRNAPPTTRASPGPGVARPPAPADRAAAASQALRGVRQVARKVWIVCLGYRRYLYERDHPRVAAEPMPLEEAVGIANECLNPVGFLSDG
jgi:hypothetical protein